MANASMEAPSKAFGGAGGRWAAERLLKAMEEGREPRLAELRTAGTLRSYEWVQFDEVVVQESVIRLKGVADLIARGLVKPVANGLGKTVFQYDKASDLGPADVSLDGLARTEDDRVEFDPAQLPLPIIHKDFNINIRELTASRNMGEALDTMNARMAGRKVAEKVEYMLFNGGPTFQGLPIYGYTNHPKRNTGGYTNSAWALTTPSGTDILNDVLKMIEALQADGFYGPYGLYVPTNTGVRLDADFKANSALSIRQRLAEVDGLASILTADQCPASQVVMAQLSEDVVCLVQGEAPQTVQWDVQGGMQVAFKVMAIQIPLVRATKSDNSGIYHMS